MSPPSPYRGPGIYGVKSFNLSGSSTDSAPTNNGELDESDISQPLPGGQQNANENGGTSRRKSKKKNKKSKKRRESSEVALVGWNGTFPNLSSNHSLESSSDVDVAQLPADLKAIGATGLSVFPREEPTQQQQQQLQLPSTSPPPLLSSSPSTSSFSPTTNHSSLPVLSDKTSEITSTTTTTTVTATTSSCTIINSTASSSPKSNMNYSTASIGCPTPEPSAEPKNVAEPQPEPEPQPKYESETLADFSSQPKSSKKNRGEVAAEKVVPTPPPKAPGTEESLKAVAVTDSASSSATTDKNNRESRKRPSSSTQNSSPLEQLENDLKRVKKSKSADRSPSIDYVKRQRSKSFYQVNTELVPRVTRSRSICASNLLGLDEPKLASNPVRKVPDRRRSMVANKLPATDKFYCLPFKYGWKRELVLRSNASLSRPRGDVIFISPAGKKLRSRDDIIPLLFGELTIDHFCFQRQMQQAGDEFESVRQAQPAAARRKSLAAPKQQQQQQQTSPMQKQLQEQPIEQQQNLQQLNEQQQQQQQQQQQHNIQKRTPASGKRVPKPKVPKGASPPPEGWTCTMAVKGNSRVLAASNSNSGKGSSSGASQNSRKRSNQSTKSVGMQPSLWPLQPKPQPPVPAPPLAQSQQQVQHQSQLNASQQQPQRQAQAQGQPATQVPTQPAQPQAKLGPQKLGDNEMICVYCLKPFKENQKRFAVGSAEAAKFICQVCVIAPKPGKEIADAENQQENQPSNENANANAGNNNFATKEALQVQNADSNGSMLGIAEEIELPGELPPAQLLSSPVSRAGNKITPKLMEIVVINGRKALAIAGEPPRPRLQVIPRTPNLELYEKHYRPKHLLRWKSKEQHQALMESLSAGIQSCQVMSAVMKTLDLHDRVRMSYVCKTWAMIGRDRSVWSTLKLRNTHISNWLYCLRDMARNRTRELDMMGCKWGSSKMRMEGDLRVLKSLRILRTDACEADFMSLIFKRLTRLQQLRATCTSRSLSLTNIDRMVDLEVLRIRLTDSKANITSLQPLQKLQNLRELSLRGVSSMSQLDLLQLQGLTKLETLILGSCRGVKFAAFGDQVLPNLKRLRNLRLEDHPSNRSFNVAEIMKGLAVKAPASGDGVKRLELINVNVDKNFSRQLGECKSVEELLLMPNFHNNTANMMHYVMQAINENGEQLKVFRLGITFELLSVTRALAMSQEKDCIPVALPIPGVSQIDTLNQSDEPIAYLPVDRLESILHHMMPQAWLTVAKVSQSETTNLKFLMASPNKDYGGGANTN